MGSRVRLRETKDWYQVSLLSLPPSRQIHPYLNYSWYMLCLNCFLKKFQILSSQLTWNDQYWQKPFLTFKIKIFFASFQAQYLLFQPQWIQRAIYSLPIWKPVIYLKNVTLPLPPLFSKPKNHTLSVPPPTAHPQDLQPSLLLYSGLYAINLHLPWMRSLKKDLILQLKHEQMISFKCLAHKTVPYKDQYKFHCQHHTATKQMNKWLTLNSWGIIKPLCRIVIYTVVFPIPAVNYN